MPHDVNGNVLKVGDTVVVRCKVREIHQTEEFCNLSLETERPMFPSDNRTALTLNARQVHRLSDPDGM